MQFIEIKNQVSQIIGNHFKIISLNKEKNYVLVELVDYRRIIVDLNNNHFYSTKTLDDGILFEGTGHVLDQPLSLKDLELIEPKYKGRSLTIRLMEILNLTSEVGWSVVDQIGKLYLVHYNDDADMSVVGHLRGVLVDVEAGLIIASSFGYTPTVCMNQLGVTNGEIVLYDNDNVKHTFGNETMIKRVYEGVILRVIYYEGEIYRLTHRKIRPLKSRWSNSNFFPILYKEAGGPLDSQMFDLSKKYSPMCYVFLVVHPKLLIATRQRVNNPYVVLLSINQMWNPQNCPFNQEEVEMECKYSFQMSNQISCEINEPFIHYPESLDLNQANKHLLYGFYNTCPIMDVRQLPGEALILYKFNQGKVVDIVKVNSIAYNYRFNLRNNDSSIYHQFYNLVNHSYQSLTYYTNFVEFRQKFLLYNYSKEELIEHITNKKLYLDEDDQFERKDRQKLLEIIWANYVFALPLNMQLEATEFLEKFIVERDQVVRWLQAYEMNNHYLNKNDISDRGVSLISAARTTAHSLINTGKAKKYDETIKHIIKNFIYNEFGTSLFGLVKKMKNIKDQ